MSFRIINGKLYLVDVHRKRYPFPELCRLVESACLKYKPDHLVIERASNGVALIEHLNEKLQNTDFVGRFIPFVNGISPTQNKITRMELAMVAVEEGRVVLPDHAEWLPGLEAELRAFPNGQYNDQVDAFSQAVKFFTWYMQHPIAEERKRSYW